MFSQQSNDAMHEEQAVAAMGQQNNVTLNGRYDISAQFHKLANEFGKSKSNNFPDTLKMFVILQDYDTFNKNSNGRHDVNAIINCPDTLRRSSKAESKYMKAMVLELENKAYIVFLYPEFIHNNLTSIKNTSYTFIYEVNTNLKEADDEFLNKIAKVAIEGLNAKSRKSLTTYLITLMNTPRHTESTTPTLKSSTTTTTNSTQPITSEASPIDLSHSTLFIPEDISLSLTLPADLAEQDNKEQKIIESETEHSVLSKNDDLNGHYDISEQFHTKAKRIFELKIRDDYPEKLAKIFVIIQDFESFNQSGKFDKQSINNQCKDTLRNIIKNKYHREGNNVATLMKTMVLKIDSKEYILFIYNEALHKELVDIEKTKFTFIHQARDPFKSAKKEFLIKMADIIVKGIEEKSGNTTISVLKNLATIPANGQQNTKINPANEKPSTPQVLSSTTTTIRSIPQHIASETNLDETVKEQIPAPQVLATQQRAIPIPACEVMTSSTYSNLHSPQMQSYTSQRETNNFTRPTTNLIPTLLAENYFLKNENERLNLLVTTPAIRNFNYENEEMHKMNEVLLEDNRSLALAKRIAEERIDALSRQQQTQESELLALRKKCQEQEQELMELKTNTKKKDEEISELKRTFGFTTAPSLDLTNPRLDLINKLIKLEPSLTDEQIKQVSTIVSNSSQHTIDLCSSNAEKELLEHCQTLFNLQSSKLPDNISMMLKKLKKYPAEVISEIFEHTGSQKNEVEQYLEALILMQAHNIFASALEDEYIEDTVHQDYMDQDYEMQKTMLEKTIRKCKENLKELRKENDDLVDQINHTRKKTTSDKLIEALNINEEAIKKAESELTASQNNVHLYYKTNKKMRHKISEMATNIYVHVLSSQQKQNFAPVIKTMAARYNKKIGATSAVKKRKSPHVSESLFTSTEKNKSVVGANPPPSSKRFHRADK